MSSNNTVVPKADVVDGFKIEPNEPVKDLPPTGRFDNLDGFVNQLTGVGDFMRDKTMGGMRGGPSFQVTFLAGTECEDRWRGSDLGARIIETLPDEMTREGWELMVQPEEEEQQIDGPQPQAKTDDFPSAAPAAPPPPPGLTAMIEGDESGQALLEDMDDKMRELAVQSRMREALCYERAYGGAGIFIGVDEGSNPSGKPFKLDGLYNPATNERLDGQVLASNHPQNLTAPLDESRVRSVRHLTALRGGWDGELIAWRYYSDPRAANYGQPEVYMLRNLGVPLAQTPAPGERNPPPVIAPSDPGSPFGPLIFFVHESRLLVFPGQAVSRRARVQMRGWGDSVFIRVNEVLSQYSQTWNATAILMTEWAQGVLKMEGLADMLASTNPKNQSAIAQRALALQMTQSIARVRIIDSKEEFKREVAPLSGIADVLEQFALRLAAAAGIPLSLLMGQVKGGLGDAGNTDARFFYDRVASSQRERMLPQIERLYRLCFLAKDSPTQGTLPSRWSVNMKPLFQPTEKDEIEMRNKQAQTDQIYVNIGVNTPEEIAGSRFGGSKWSAETVLDLQGRAQLSKMFEKQSAAPGAETTTSAAVQGTTTPKETTNVPASPDKEAPALEPTEPKPAPDEAAK